MNLSATSTGFLNEFENFYGNVEFDYNNHEAYEVCESFFQEDLDLQDDEFWCAKFEANGNTYFIGANGSLTSSGTYALKMVV